MKLIIQDFLRRWWGAYFLAVIFVGGMLAVLDMAAGFTFVGVLILPFVFELSRNTIGLMAVLPVSRRTIALSYWGIGVLLPTTLMAGIFLIDALVFPSFLVSVKGVALILFGSLFTAGSALFLFSLISRNTDENIPGNFLVLCLGTLWFLATMYGFGHQRVLKTGSNSPIVYLVGLIGLVFTIWGYRRAEKLFFGAVSQNLAGERRLCLAKEPVREIKPGTIRFKAVGIECLFRGFLGGMIVSVFLLIFRHNNIGDMLGWPFVLAIGGAGSLGNFGGDMRLLRSLPLSVGQIALTLLLMPLCSIVAIIAGLAAGQSFLAGHLISHYPFSLLPLTGAVCIACGFMIPFRKDGLMLATVAGMAMAAAILNITFAPIVAVALGLCLIVTAFFLNRYWLGCSRSYR